MKKAAAVLAIALALEGALILQLALPGGPGAAPPRLVQAAAPRAGRS